MNDKDRVPVVCVDRSAVAAFSLFNPNDWTGQSRGVVQSCATELSVLRYSVARIDRLCADAKDACRHHFEALNGQWQISPWDLGRSIYFGQVPELHVLIESFFAGLKSLLDLDSQLLTTERIAGVALDGFHRTKDVYGGTVINALDNNVRNGKEVIAATVKALIMKHKAAWIDAAIASRDMLVHPVRGAQQLMFEIRVENSGESLDYLGAVPPHVSEVPIGSYTSARIEDVYQFSAELLKTLREAA